MYDQVTILFKSAPDLIDEFKQFLPDPNGSNGGLFGVLAGAGASEMGKGDSDKDAKRRGPIVTNVAIVDKSGIAPKRKKRVLDKETVAAPKPGQSKVYWSELDTSEPD